MKKRVMTLLVIASLAGAVATNVSAFENFVPSSHATFDAVHADDDYTQNKLTDYKIPTAVIQTIIDNSVASNGKTPKENGKTVSNFTVADFRDLTTVSLADRTKKDDGTVTSATNDAVASAIGDVEILNSNDAGQVSNDKTTALINQSYIDDNNRQGTMTNLLKNGGFTRGSSYTTGNIWLNELIALIATNTKLTTLDLTGAFSKLEFTNGYNKVAELVAMMTYKSQTLTSLAIGYNPIISQEVQNNSWFYYNYALNLPNLTDLDLRSNGFTTLNTEILQNVQNKMKVLNLAGNAITSITTNAENVFKQSTVDLSNADLSALDSNTHKILVSALNSGNGGLEISDAATNQLISASINDGWADVNVSSSGLNKVADQLEATTVDKIASTKPTLVDSTVMDTLVSNNASALTGSSVEQIIKSNPTVVDADTMGKLASANPDAITAGTLEHLASTNADAISPEVINKVGAANPDAITSDLINNLAESGNLDADTLTAIASAKPDAIKDLTPEQQATIKEKVGADQLDKVQNILDNPESVKPTTPTTPDTQFGVKVDKSAIVFDTANLADITPQTVINAQSSLRVSGTMSKGQSLRLASSTWTTSDNKASFTPTLIMQGEDAVANKVVNEKVAANGSQELVAASDAPVTFDVLFNSIGMSNISGVRAGQSYTGTLTWELNNTPGETIN